MPNTEEELSPMFYKLWGLMRANITNLSKKENNPYWRDYEIFAITTRDLEMNVWNGKHDPSVEANCKKHICKSGTKVRVWMLTKI